jgi:transposase-like protein
MEKLSKKICPNSDCQDFGKVNGKNIIDHASFKSQSGRKQRCLCKTCGTTFSANTGTAYFGLRCTREEFDHASQMRVEGLSISAIARITGRSRTTIAHWLERAAIFAKNFNNERACVTMKLKKFKLTNSVLL